MIQTHTKTSSLVTVSYMLIFAIFGGTMYFVQQQGVNTERRTRATSAVSCDYTIDIVAASLTPTPTTAADPATPTATATPEATPTIPDVACEKRVSIGIVIDRSTSMYSKDISGKTKLEQAREAAIAFVTAIKESGSKNVKVTVVSFGGQGNDGTGTMSRSSDSTLHISASSDYDAVLSAIGGVTIKGSGSCIQCGIRIANDQITSFPDTKAVILLSDGQAGEIWDGSSSGATSATIREADNGRAKGITYYVMGFGDKSKGKINEQTLQSIAGNSGQYVYKPDAQTWMKGFLDLLPNFCTPVGQ